jgi:carboxypeptidase family protein
MRGLVSVLALALVVGVLPATVFAQQAPPSESLVARCDLPVVDLFNPLPGDVLQPGAYLISGLALDPMAPADSSGIDQVAFFLGDRDQGGLSLGSVVPSAGLRQADFSLTVMLPNGAPDVPQQLEAFAHSALSGKETQVSMPVVLGQPASGATADPSANVVNTNPGVLPDTCGVGDALPSIAPSVAPTATTTGGGAAPPAPTIVPSVGKPVQGSIAPLFGSIVGTVTDCQGGTEVPVGVARIQVQGTSAGAISDLQGVFAIMQVPAPGTYTVVVSDGQKTATRMYVPVAPGETIDIGTLQLGADVTAGCGEGLPPTT